MGYFSNGTEGTLYEDRYCARCIHNQDPDNGCPVWGLHFLYNYDQLEDKGLRDALTWLIPRTKDGTDNEECTMFVDPTQVEDPRQANLGLKE